MARSMYTQTPARPLCTPVRFEKQNTPDRANPIFPYEPYFPLASAVAYRATAAISGSSWPTGK